MRVKRNLNSFIFNGFSAGHTALINMARFFKLSPNEIDCDPQYRYIDKLTMEWKLVTYKIIELLQQNPKIHLHGCHSHATLTYIQMIVKVNNKLV